MQQKTGVVCGLALLALASCCSARALGEGYDLGGHYGGHGGQFEPIHQHSAVLHDIGGSPMVRVVRVPVPEHIPVPMPQLVGVPVPHPYPVYVRELEHVEVPVTQTVHVPVEKPYHVEVERKVPYPVERPYHVTVERPVEVVVPKPYEVRVPVYKHVYHVIKQKKTDDWRRSDCCMA